MTHSRSLSIAALSIGCFMCCLCVQGQRYLFPNDYMADPSARVFNDRIYIYPSHDRESGVAENDNGDHFNMRDYHVFSLNDVENGTVTDHGKALDVDDIPWAGRQLWAPDVAHKNGTYYLYFPLKDKQDIFRIGVATANKPEGPFKPQPEPIKGSYSIDPGMLEDEGNYYMYFGGLWGGQLQNYDNNKLVQNAQIPADNQPALPARVAKMTSDMLQFAETPRPIVLLDKEGKVITQGDTERRFFEAPFIHKRGDTYYFSYSTGDTHLLCYATAKNPYGPFTYQGVILTPVVGWTTHHSIVDYRGKTYLFYHDSAPSGGCTWLRSMKVIELKYNPDGSIKTIDGMAQPSLKDLFAGRFLLGTALNARQINGQDTASMRLTKQHFNSIVAENCMKSAELHPEKDRYDFALADRFVQYGINNNMHIAGHTLIWHSQLPRWFCTDEQGKDVSPEVLKQNMKEHISTVVGRYKGKVKGWDVVNEAIEDNGAWRKSAFYRILGEEFIPLAFQYAHEADPDAELYYNDYNMWMPGKRAAVVKLVAMLKARGIRIDAVGMQGHVDMTSPKIEEFEQSMKAYIAAGVDVQITEFDISALPSPYGRSTANISDRAEYEASLNPYTNGLPQQVQDKWNERVSDFFRLFLKYSDNLKRVTFWGVSDRDSWKNGFPVRGRTDYPLLFDRSYRLKWHF